MNYKIKLLPSEIEFNANAEQSILASALQNDIHLEHSCSNGQCGQCIANVVNGNTAPLKSDINITLEADHILTCCTKPTSDLTLNATYYPELSQIKKKTLPAKINQIHPISDDVIELTLRLPPTHSFQYLAGQYIDLIWQNNKRSYSIAHSQIKDNKLVLHIKKVNNGIFSTYLFNDAQENQLLRLHGPLGTFFIRQTQKPIIFVCTGTGFAPVKAMVEHLIETQFEQAIHIFWGGRNRKDLYSTLPQAWSDNHPNIKFRSVLSQDEIKHNNEFSGYVQHAVINSYPNLSSFDVYACGSPQMISDAKTLFLKHQLDDKHFYSDAFLPSN